MLEENKVPKSKSSICKYTLKPYRTLKLHRVSGLVVFAFSMAAFLVLTQWSSIVAWPGVSCVAALIIRDTLPQADPHRFSVAVAHLEDDDANHTYEKLIVRLLQEFEGIEVLAFDRTIPVESSLPEEHDRKGHETARRYLKASNASILIWGRCLSTEAKANSTCT